MAIPLPRENVIDNEDEKFIGIKLPLEKSDGIEGYFKSTETTFEAVKENIRNLLNTRSGERLFNPTIGTTLNDILFENIDNEMLDQIRDQINDIFGLWMPFITIRNLNISIDDNNFSNKLNIDLEFFMNQNPNILESVQLTIE